MNKINKVGFYMETIKLNELRMRITLFLFALFAAGCSQVKFQGEMGPSTSSTQSYYFKLNPSETEVTQVNLAENKTSLTFQVLDANGNSVQNLKNSDFVVTENGTPLKNIKLDSNSEKIVQTVDIVFVIDITGSMTTSIDAAKTHVINFIKTSRKNGIHSRMCIVTFGDYTVKKCDRFFDNNPDDPKTESQVAELVSEITKLKALAGANDPGGYDLNENPMRALIDASLAPWDPKSQRFAILLTDDAFLYSPSNQGAVGKVAPYFSEVLSAIQTSQMKVFAATPNWPGYNTSFQGNPGIVPTSGGEYFNFDDLISGQITFNTILNRIVDKVKVTYAINYIAREEDGCEPYLALKDRKISVTLKDGNSKRTLTLVSTDSSLPDGRDTYKKSWHIAEAGEIDQDSLEAELSDDKSLLTSHINDAGDLEISPPPPAGAKIKVKWLAKELKKALVVEPIHLPAGTDLGLVQILLNGVDSGLSRVVEMNQDEKPLRVIEQADGSINLELTDWALSQADPLHIRKQKGLSVEVITTILHARYQQ